jgi:hypothetical protein
LGYRPGASIESPEQELTRLRRENRELHMRCEILKKQWASSATHP